MSGLEVEVREKRFAAVAAAEPHLAIRDLELTAQHGEFVCLLGPSGCGKTTLLNIIAGLDRDFDGRVSLPSVAGRGAPRIGYVFQEPRLLPWLTVRQNVELVLDAEQVASGIVDRLLETTGLAGFAEAYPQRLSLGMSRRVALVRAFSIQPDVLLMDEPFVSLDEASADRLRQLLLSIWREHPTTVLFVSHDVQETILLADRIVLLSDAPARVIGALPLALDRAQRRNPQVVQELRDQLLRVNPILSAAF